ncbi:MAG: SpoIIE family protein phosphatase, partial [Lachnospiraceae bacterium]|nr:SpoIIE family protein phosphatase [Lachnospiraceae bacterium]
MKISDRLKGIGFAVAAFFIGRAFVMNLNPFAIGALVAFALSGENMWLIFIGLMGGVATMGSAYTLFEYGAIMIFLIIILGLKNSINLRGKNFLTAIITFGLTFVVHGTTGFVTDGRYFNFFDTGIMAALSFATVIIFYKGVEGLKEDPLSIVSNNETALGVIAFFAAVFYGMPLEFFNITVAQAFFIFSILFAWYKYGFGIGLTWTVVSSVLMGIKSGENGYLMAYLTVSLLVYALLIFIEGGRFIQAASFLIIYYIVGFSRFDMLLDEEGIKALYSAILVFILAPDRLMLRVDDKAAYYEPDNTPEWGRIVVERVNNLADAFKRIEYTFAGDAGAGIGFNDVGNIIENFTNQLNEMVPIRKTIEASIIEELSKKEVLVKNILMVKNRDERYEVYINARVRRGRLVTAETVKKIVEDKMKVRLLLKDESKSIVSKRYEMLCMIEKPDFRCETAVRRLSRYEDEISGDNFYIGDIQNGQKLLLIADGMGNGEKASRDSNQLIDSLEELLNAGFDKEMSIRVVNSYLSEKNKGESFSTLDMMIVDLYTGCGRIYKQGAATTFVKRGEWIEMIKSTSLPVGITPDAISEKCMKKFYTNDMI